MIHMRSGSPNDNALVRRIKRRQPAAQILVAARFRDMPALMRELKNDAAEFVSLPIDAVALEIALNRCREKMALLDALHAAHHHADARAARIVETERFVTVKQILDKLSTFIGRIANDVDGGIRYFGEMPFFVAIHSRELKLVAANAMYKKQFGHKAGANSWDIYSAPHGTRSKCPVGRTVSSGQSQRQKARVQYLSGTQVPVIVHTAPIFNNDGQVELILEVSAGSREVKSLRGELKASRQKYQQLFDEVPCYVAVLDRTLRITTINRRFREDFGYQAGQAFFDIFKPATGGDSCPLRETAADGRPHYGEMVLTDSGGHTYKTLVWTSPIHTAAGKLLQILVIFADITPMRKLQDNLTSLGLMIGSMSHGIKGVLNGIGRRIVPDRFRILQKHPRTNRRGAGGRQADGRAYS